MLEKCLVWLVGLALVAIATYIPSTKSGMCSGGWGWGFLHVGSALVFFISLPVTATLIWGWQGLPWGLVACIVCFGFYYKKIMGG